MLNLLLVSSSRCHPHDYLDHCAVEMQSLFVGAREIAFVPFARPGGISHDAYTEIAQKRFAQIGIHVRGIHEFHEPAAGLEEVDGVFVGGGNTFVLLSDLYQNRMVDVLRRRINSGMPYMGTSAGSNIAGLTIGTSNDMPIVEPKSFTALGLVPFNINPHFPAAKPDATHKGETREDRIREFHFFNDQPVLAMHEDGMLRITDNEMRLVGTRPALLFEKNLATPRSFEPGRLPGLTNR